jgi:hypothetical protein
MGSQVNIFADIERMDADAWAKYLALEAVMRFGSSDPVHGRTACRDALASFDEQIDGLRHQVMEQRQQAVFA